MRRRGFRRYAEYQLECTKANSYNPSPQAPLKGLAGVAVLDGVQPLNAELSCRRSG